MITMKKVLTKRPSSWTLILAALISSAKKNFIMMLFLLLGTTTGFGQVVFISESEITSCGGPVLIEGAVSGDVVSYEWSSNGVVIAVNENPTYGDNYTSIYTSTVIGTAIYTLTGYFVGDVIKADSVIINILPIPPQKCIVPSGSIMIVSGDGILLETDIGDSWQWYLNNNIIPGAISQTYYATLSGDYTVRVTIGICWEMSNPTTVTVTSVGIQPIMSDDNLFNVYPNPASTQVYLEFPVLQENAELVLINMLGQKMYSTNVEKDIGGATIALERFPKGIYFITLNSSKKISSKKLIIY